MHINTPSGETGKQLVALSAILNIVIIKEGYLTAPHWYLWLIVSIPILVISAGISSIRER